MTSTSASKTLHANQEHTGIRVAVPAILIVVGVIVFLTAYVLLESLPPGGIGDYAVFLACMTGLLFGLAVAALAEAFLKRQWHSGYAIHLDEWGIRVEVSEKTTAQLEAGKRFSKLCWHFVLKGYPKGGRERRVPGSWLCLACQIQQDDDRFIVFTFMPPKKAEHLTKRREFHEIRPAEFYEGGAVRRLISAPSRPSLPSNVLAGNEGLYWLGERRRWEEGLELTPEDFETLLNWLEENYQD